MNKIKILFMALLMGFFVQPAIAQTSTNTDLAYAFGGSPDIKQIDLLTDQEMEDVQGERWRTNWRASIRYDRKPHRFTSKWGPLQGNRPHFQVTVYRVGVSGSDRHLRIPAGARTQWGSHKP